MASTIVSPASAPDPAPELLHPPPYKVIPRSRSTKPARNTKQARLLFKGWPLDWKLEREATMRRKIIMKAGCEVAEGPGVNIQE